MASGRAYDPDSSWRNNARGQQQTAQPFRAIIQADNPEGREDVLTEMDLHERNPRWHVSAFPIRRTSTDIAAAVAPLGRISRELHFVDPYFGPGKKWSSVLIELLHASQVDARPYRCIRVHTGTKTPRPLLESEARQWIAPKVARGVPIRFCLWRERDGGEKFHARYFLTDRGGIASTQGSTKGNLGRLPMRSCCLKTCTKYAGKTFRIRRLLTNSSTNSL